MPSQAPSPDSGKTNIPFLKPSQVETMWASVDYERTLGERGGSVVVTLPSGIRQWLGAELKESLYLLRSRDGDDILVEAP